MSHARDLSDQAAHLLDHYGHCAVELCQCNRGQWVGRRCPNWRPSGSTSNDDLMARARRAHGERRT